MRPGLLAVCATVFLLLGCGQDTPEPETTAARELASPAQVEDDRPAIVAFGDSITEGAGVDEDESYPAQLQRLLDNAGFGYRVANEGISGDTSSGGRVRTSAVTALKPEIVILELGGNDGLRGLPVDTTRANLEEIILALKAAETKVVFVGMTLPPNYGREYISEFENLYRELAAKHGVPLVPVLPEGLAPTSELVQEDRIHPTPAGHRLLAENVMRAITPLLDGPADASSAPAGQQ